MAKGTIITHVATITLQCVSQTSGALSSLKIIELNGTVLSGVGGGKKFLELPYVKQKIKEKLGFAPYAGTLNVKLTKESAKRIKLLEKTRTIKICPAEGYCTGALFKAFIGILECAIVVPEVEGYPNDLLEIIAPVNLRKMLQLEDGSEVTVTVNL
jgi:riboflavin kinase